LLKNQVFTGLHKIIKNRIKRLLLAGKSQSAIALRLSIPRSRVRKLKQEIIHDRATWNKKKKLLQVYHPVITGCLKKCWKVRKIHEHLLALNVRLSYSTVARFVACLAKVERMSKFTAIPGTEAKIFFIPIGKFFKDGRNIKVWVFLMKLSYSKYCFCLETTDGHFESFLQCHHKAFAFFKSVPGLIKINRTQAFNINDPTLKDRYIHFLDPCGIGLFEKDKRNCFINCPSEVRFFKERFLFQIVHRDYYRLSRDLKRWYRYEVNLGIHPFTKKIIQKEFLFNEQPEMAVYPIK
jgi:hypothetical protein